MITSGSGRPLESDMALVVKMWQENNVLVLGVGLEERWPPSRHRGHTLGLGSSNQPFPTSCFFHYDCQWNITNISRWNLLGSLKVGFEW